MLTECFPVTPLSPGSDPPPHVAVVRYRLARFEKTNAKLASFNDMAQARLAESQATFARHTQLLLDAKRDLQSVFRRIRTLKARLSERYPEGFAGEWTFNIHVLSTRHVKNAPLLLIRPKCQLWKNRF